MALNWELGKLSSGFCYPASTSSYVTVVKSFYLFGLSILHENPYLKIELIFEASRILFFFFFSFQNFIGEKQPTYFLISSQLAFYPHDRLFSGFDLASGLLGSLPSAVFSLLPGGVCSPPGQSPWMGSHVGAVIAVCCGRRTWLQQGHQLEHTRSYSFCPSSNPNGNEILRLSFQGPRELPPREH